MSNYHLFIYLIFIIISLTMLKLQTIKEDLQEELYLRIRSWWWMLLILFSACLGGELMVSLLLGIIGILALMEINGNSKLTLRTAIILWILFLSVQISTIYLTPAMSALLCFVSSLYIYIRLQQSRNITISKSLIFYIATTFCILNFSLLSLHILNKTYSGTQNFGLFLFLIFCAQFNDVGQYICGKSFGKTALSPKISPSKTLEGAVGGTLLTTLIGTIVSQLITPLSVIQALLCCFSICILGIMGDLYTSKFKRQLKIKDMGNIIPGHGGILDRIDSLLLSAPIFTIIVTYFLVI